MNQSDDFGTRFEKLLHELDEAMNDPAAAEQEAALTKRAEQRATSARSGALGADWKTVQRRIDQGETTLAAVFSGADETVAARRLRELSRKNLQALSDSWRESDESDTTQGRGRQSPAAEITKARDESRKHYQDLTRQVHARLRGM